MKKEGNDKADVGEGGEKRREKVAKGGKHEARVNRIPTKGLSCSMPLSALRKGNGP